MTGTSARESRKSGAATRRRGYLLAEVMVASGIAGAALLSAAVGVAEMNHRRTVAAREAMAGQLLAQSLEQAVAAGYTRVADGTWPTAAAETLSYVGEYTRTVNVSAVTEAAPSGTINVQIVTVNVTFVDGRGFTHSRTANLRMFDDNWTDGL